MKRKPTVGNQPAASGDRGRPPVLATGRRGRLMPTWLPAALLVLLTLLCYAPVMLEGGYIWDDDRYVTENPVLTSPMGLFRIWFEPGATVQYYPLVFTSFWIEHLLWNLHPAGYHVVNVLLHALCALLLWGILRRLRVPCAWMAAAVFALHPVHVESVAWITERKNVLSGAFYLSALFLFLRFLGLFSIDTLETAAAGKSEHLSARRDYVPAILLFVCALFSKTVTSTLPVALVLVIWWKKKRIDVKTGILLLPLFLLGAAAGTVTIWMEKFRVGAQGADWAFSAPDRFLIAGRAIWFYVGKLVWPHPLVFSYPKWGIDATVWWQYAFPVSAVLAVSTLWFLRERIGRAPLTAALFFVVTLFPALGFINVYPMRYTFVADHFQYLASIGPITLFVAAACALMRRRLPKVSTPAVGALVLSVFGALVWHQGGAYRSAEAIWRDTLSKNPDSWMAHNNLGTILADGGKLDDAISHYNIALRLKPDHSRAYNNLGSAFSRLGKIETALAYYAEALKLRPDDHLLHNNIANAYSRLKKFGDAATHYAEAIRLKPDFPDAYYNLGLSLENQNKPEAAARRYAEALRVNPDHLDARIKLGAVRIQQGRAAEALGLLQTAATLAPDSAQARYYLGIALFEKGRVNEAIDQYEKALETQPGIADIHNVLGIALLRQERFEAAIRHFTLALKIEPDFEEARYNLERAVGQRSEDSLQRTEDR